MTDFEKVTSFENLYQSFLNVKSGRTHRLETIRFEQNLAYNLKQLQIQLLSGEYQMMPYYHFVLHEPKTRDVYAARFVDKLVMNVICEQVLIPRLEPHLIEDNVACRKGKGVHYGIRRFTEFLRRGYRKHGQELYVLKCDISKFFASVPHDVLLEKVAKRVKDARVMDLLVLLLKSYDSISETPGIGIPLGNNTSQWFALYYLSSLDHFVKEQLQVKGYIRYMDDFLLLHHDKGFLWECFMEIERIVTGDLRLRLNPKTNIFPVKHGVEFLGWKFFLLQNGKIKRQLKLQSKKRYKKAMGTLMTDYARGTKDLHKVKQILASHHGHLIHGHAYLLEARALKQLVLRRYTDFE